MFTQNYLYQLKNRALRKGIWVKILDRTERGILSLVQRVVHRVKSDVLYNVLSEIIKKIQNAIKSDFIRYMENYGLSKVLRLSKIALNWGNENALSWTCDIGFVRYVTNIHYNSDFY